jgi:hypothetical protein
LERVAITVARSRHTSNELHRANFYAQLENSCPSPAVYFI